ncbi:hypothetical protein FBD94_07160 [Pedobacter hiemivivus]|uniref:Uncharacterized protein n=1 Tax=Pedobacter hiemivivus TaxID=2530454 RepID=A0A4U1GM55_9SPHI|nr:hypothetical protein [Pedobacter hiemivivus]TKC64110.1 hypothetical protein FBD94_07160 [Pedobacter hiemivivus]
MGISFGWKNVVLTTLQDVGIDVRPVEHEKYDLLLCNDKVVLNLIALDNNYSPVELIELQSAYQLKNITLLQLWEDVWLARQEQVLGRIKSVLGLNKRLHGRKGEIIVINQNEADDFLNRNHIHESARAKYKFALQMDGQIVAVACFSNIRLMKRIAPDYKSVELIRFAALIGYTVTGGFTKLLKHFIKMVTPNDVMSYADRDWSLGNAYAQSGFKLVNVTPPAQIWLHKTDLQRCFSHRLPVAAPEVLSEYLPIFNTGNLKYILYLA